MKKLIKFLSIVSMFCFGSLAFNSTSAMESNPPENITFNTKNTTSELNDLKEQLETVNNSLSAYEDNNPNHKTSPLETILIQIKNSLETQIKTIEQNKK